MVSDRLSSINKANETCLAVTVLMITYLVCVVKVHLCIHSKVMKYCMDMGFVKPAINRIINKKIVDNF